MTYYGAGDLAAAFRLVRSNTIQIAEEIPEDKYGFRATDDTRSVAQLLVHIAVAPRFQLHVHRNGIADFQTLNFLELIGPLASEETKSRTKGEILALLRSGGELFASYIGGVSDAFLSETVKMPAGAKPPTKTRFEMLMSAKEHEMHHRGQLMTIQRMLGMVPPLTRAMQERIAAMQASKANA